MRVFIVSSSAATREALRRRAEAAGLQVAGESTEPAADAVSGPPDVLLLCDRGALDFLGVDPDVSDRAVVVVGANDAEAFELLSALDLRGWAVLPSDADAEELGAAAVSASAGFAMMPLEAFPGGRVGTARYPVERDAEADDEELEEPLTRREREVLEQLAHGLSNRDIAGRLGMSEHTAKFHVASVLAKLGAPNRADAVRRGIRRGLVSI